MTQDFWRGRRVFLTGHTGFKGAWLSLWLQSLGAEVIGYALAPPTDPNLFFIAQVDTNMESILGDINDFATLSSCMQQAKPEVVIHMAAQSLVRQSYKDPVETYQTNVMGCVHVLEALRRCPEVRAFVNVTSDKCYENREWERPYDEGDALGGFDPYSSSKGCAEIVTSAYRQSYFSDKEKVSSAIATARAGNVIGGGDWAADRLIPDMVRSIAAGQKLQIRYPRAIRPWQHVLEPLSGYLTLAQNLYENGTVSARAWNFGPDGAEAQPVHWIVERAASIWGDDMSWETEDVSHPHEAHYLKLDASLAKDHLGWRGKWPIEIAVDRTIRWYKAHYEGCDMRTYTLNEIADYQQTASS